MFNVLCMEFKRLFRSRMVWILCAASLVVALLLCVMVVDNVSYGRRDDPEAKIGLEAVAAVKEAYRPLYGAVTPEKLESAFETYINTSNAYEEKMPASVYKEKIVPIQPALSWIFSAFDDSEITSADEVGGFYAQRLRNIENQLADKYANAPQAKQAALALNSRVETPFNYAYGYGDTSPDIIVLLLLVLGLFCTAMAAPVFSADYHSRADDIQRCTRYGRGLSLIHI